MVAMVTLYIYIYINVTFYEFSTTHAVYRVVLIVSGCHSSVVRALVAEVSSLGFNSQ